MISWKKVVLIAVATVAVGGCKDVVNPHMNPEGDPSRLVASMAAATNQAMLARTGAQQLVLTINNAPEANAPLEQDFLTEIVELFEKRNPSIRIQYSPWQYTPESFFERFNNRTLTDIVEVDASQMVPIIEADAAADLTENVKVTPEMRIMNPDVFTVTSKNGRTYGVPTELHTLALFYNRRMLENSKIVVPQKSEDVPKGKGAAGEARDFVLDYLHPELEDGPRELAQYAQPQYYPPGYQAPQRSQRGQNEVQNYYNQRPNQNRQQPQQQQQQQPQSPQQQQQQYYQQYYNQYYQQQQNQGQGNRQQQSQPEEDARERRVKSRKASSKPDDASNEVSGSSKKKRSTSDGDSGSTETTSDDTLTTEAEMALQEQRPTATDAVTTVIKTAGLPADMEQFIRLAVRLTDHKKGVYGYGPVLYASEGGREYTQWAVEAGLDMQKIDNTEVTLDVDQSGEVAQFLKDLHHRFDVTPPPQKCYYGNLMNMYATGTLAMMIMPANKETIAELIKRGMPLNDIGIAPLPRGIETRDHLTFGKCLVINSQLDQSRRAAAFQWLMFMASPEVKRLRAQFFFKENEITAAPSVPLYSPQMQEEHYASIRGYRSLPLWADYESVVASNLHPEPSFHTDRFYEALAEGVRPIIERKDSDPFQAVKLIATDFDRKFIQEVEPENLIDRYVQSFMKNKKN